MQKWAIFYAKVYFSNFSKAFQTFLSEGIFPKKFEKFDYQTFWSKFALGQPEKCKKLPILGLSCLKFEKFNLPPPNSGLIFDGRKTRNKQWYGTLSFYYQKVT